VTPATDRENANGAFYWFPPPEQPSANAVQRTYGQGRSGCRLVTAAVPPPGVHATIRKATFPDYDSTAPKPDQKL